MYRCARTRACVYKRCMCWDPLKFVKQKYYLVLCHFEFLGFGELFKIQQKMWKIKAIHLHCSLAVNQL